MNIAQRTQRIKRAFSYSKRAKVEDSSITITPFCFTQQVGKQEVDEVQRRLEPTDFCSTTDDHIQENKSFQYVIFAPESAHRHEDAIVLLHGLNERSWEKYLTWAEYLVKSTGKPVILFPLAFHMNRTPAQWSNPRFALPWVAARKQVVPDLQNSTFVNVVLSSRLASQPLRFYTSGLESVYNLIQLTGELKNGDHPLFAKDCSMNIFAYSIGALVAQVLLLANPKKLFEDTRLFMFCGGSVFSEMNGSARDIMDAAANDCIHRYYLERFLQTENTSNGLEQAFKMMLHTDFMSNERQVFFHGAQNRIKVVSLQQDTVVPTHGIVSALGEISKDVVEELDFPFSYSHQTPFPTNPKAGELVEHAFEEVFGRAAAFL
ncbi:MAG: DUF6051 family protein [Prevotellaceae bacterium]|jgi:hypothetical protein|nr:DUF6051 family protein [Prevotellaceae bacterium]